MMTIRPLSNVILGVQFCLILSGCAPIGVPSQEYNKALALVDQGTVQLRRGELIKARASYQMAYDLAQLPQGLDGLGCLAVLRGEYETAEKYFQAALERDENYDQALSNLALLYDIIGRKAEANSLYRQALAREPLNIPARSNFGAFLSDSVQGGTAEGLTELLHAQALGNHPILEENLKKVRKENGEK